MKDYQGGDGGQDAQTGIAAEGGGDRVADVNGLPETDVSSKTPDAETPVDAMDAAVDMTIDRPADFAIGGTDAFSATGGAGGTDAASGTGGVIGTDGGTATADVRSEVGDAPGADTPLDVPVGGSGGTGGTTATGGMTGSGGTTSTGGAGTGGAPTTGGTTRTGGTTTSGGTTSAGGTTTAGGTIASGGTTSAGGTTTTGGTTGSGGSSGSGGASGIGGTSVDSGTPPPSCSGLAATCGPSGNEDCCTSLPVPGNLPGEKFYRSYDGVTYTDMSHPATVADFHLDKYVITVGRFRHFVNAGMGTQANPPAAGAGVHPLITGSGWDSTWNTNLPANTDSLKAALKCDAIYQTWTDTAGSNESRPQNCMDWYAAFAFCSWDGGRLATEAEWNYAAAGGSEQREYPWGSAAPDPSKASYWVDSTQQCMGDGVAGCTLADFIVVGSKPAGNGKWGHADLAGNVWEWTLDWYVSPYATPCNNCADLTPASNRVLRGGNHDSSASVLRSAYRNYDLPEDRNFSVGSRCARSSL